MPSSTLTHTKPENKSNAVANHITSPANTANEKAPVPDDKRPQAIAQRKLQRIANSSPQAKQLRAVQAMANDRAGGDNDVKQLKKDKPAVNNDTAPVQRAISVEGHTVDDGKISKVHAFLDALDKAVLKAYTYIMNVPLLGGAYNVDGYTNLWIERWKAYDKDGDTDMIHAAFGYAVESIATLVYMPDPPAGMHILLQEPRPGTRPDVILRDDLTNLDVAWLDITSDGKGSERHILTAKVLWEKQPHYGEVTYAAVKDSDLIAMKSAPGVFDDKIDKDEFYRKRMFARYLHDIRMKHWYELGQKKFKDPLKTKGGDRMIRAIGNRLDIIQRMTDYFGIQFDSKMAASVLYVMDIGRSKFGLEDSVSMGLGQSILLRHDPNLPNMPLPKNTIPQSMPMGQDEISMFQKMNTPPPSISFPTTKELVPFSPGIKKQDTPSFNFNFNTSMFGNPGGSGMFGSQGMFGGGGGFNFSGMPGFGPVGKGGELTPFKEKTVNKMTRHEQVAKLLEKVMRMGSLSPKKMSILHDLLKKAKKSTLQQFRILKAVIRNDRGELLLLEKDLSKPLFNIKRMRGRKRTAQPTGGLPMPGLQQDALMGLQPGIPALHFGMQVVDEEPIVFDEDENLEILGIMVEDGVDKVFVGNGSFL